ncbi:sensor histidine kinase [Microvirga massiliensis]|uniref:sensor histidine kinase n=1 Tax=Microvirga massiliensis TaxID=1033741 RepID=UPI0006609663|nr:histidine kinase [Microvirga massiliensis]
MLVAMTLAGLFTSRVVSRVTIESTAAATALFMESFLSPLVQELTTNDSLPAEKAAALDHLLSGEAFQVRFPHVEVWKEGGLIVYSGTPQLIGRRFPEPDGLVAALSGTVSAQYTDLEAKEHVERAFDDEFLEVYVPIREDLSGRIIAAAEIHEVTGPLKEKLFYVQLQSWLATAALSGLLMLSLFGIVYRGNRIINEQQAALRRRMEEIREVSEQNRLLKEKAQRASSRISEMNESYLRHVGAELHDGPAQLIGLAALKVEHVRRAKTGEKQEQELRAMASALANALSEIRTISKGLMLPDIERLPLDEVVDRVVRVHEQRTRTKVTVDFRCPDQPLSHAIKICVYRFVQEGLNNAFRHAGGEGQTVTCLFKDSVLIVIVQDSGRTGEGARVDLEAGLGLTGLRERVESLGGAFRIHRSESEGTRIEMNLAVTG